MSRESMQTLSDPVFRRTMPLFDGTAASSGLSKPQAMSGFLGKQTLQYNGSYFTYEPRIKDRDGFTPPWSHSKTSPMDDRNPVSNLSGIIQNHMAYRKDGIPSEAAHHTPVKKGFTIYTKSPEMNNSTTASSGVIRKPKPGGENAPSPSQSSVYLAIPKPVYGLSPCCTELGCVIGHRYGMEHISPRIPNTVYEHEWLQTNGHYLEKLPIQRKDTLLQQKNLQFECSAEQLKRATVEAYSPSRVRTLPPVIEPSYSSYSCTPTRTLFSSFREPSSRQLQTSPASYPGLYAPRPTYEHMTSEVYQECSPMSKYGQLAQHPGFYYSQTNGEAENRTQRKESGSKQGEDGPLLHKHSIPSPREHYAVPPPHHTDIPLSCTEMLPNHSFIQGYDYPSYTVPRFHLNAGQIKTPLKGQNSLSAFHPSHINASSSSQHMDVPTAKEKPNTAVHIDHLHGASSFIRVNRSSPTRCLNPSAISPSRIQVSRFFQPFTSLHIDPAVHSQPGSNTDRIIDHSRGEAQVKLSKSLPVSQAPWLHQSPCHSSERTHAAVPNNFRKIIYSPTVKTGSKHNGPVSDAGTSDYKKCLKRSVSQSSHPVRIKDEDVYEVECTDNKRQKMETEKAKASNKTDSPPMPVIDNVFSLAPCQPHLQESGVLFPGRVTQKISQTSGKHNNKLKQNTKEKSLVQNDQESAICLESKCSSETSADEFSVETKTIKVEKADSPDVDTSTESQKHHSKVEMMNEPEETGSSVSVPVASKEKCESNELENKSLFASENTTSDELKPAELIAQMDPDNPDEATETQAVALQPQAGTLLPPGKVSFKSIPPHCLKLSTYNIIIPDGKHCKIALPAKQIPPTQPITVLTAKEEPQSPVRKHFLELHQSLCSLISKSVSASSEKDLKSWQSQLEISEPSSHLSKVQRVPCLLGAKVREGWINKEIKAALQEVLKRLREYTAQKRCPFPHVMRTGTVFLPMLVVKELLFPTVQSCFVDKVLQEHKVELRPTTLSEEKILIQLHKRACSSKLRRLMSLKHLPDIYSEMINLLYYTNVCKHLGLNMDPYYKEQDGGQEVSNATNAAPCDALASPASPSESYQQTCVKEEESESSPSQSKTKCRVKSDSRQTLLVSDEEGAGGAGQAAVEDDLKSVITKTPGFHQIENEDSDFVAAEEDLTAATQSDDNSWTCPLTLEELSPSHSDAETESSSGLLTDNRPSGHSAPSKNCSGMILKLRKMLSAGINRKRACYEAVSQSGAFAEPSSSQTEVEEGVSGESSQHRKPNTLNRWKGKGSFCHPGRSLSSCSKTKQRSLLKIKYCPYLSACHSAQHRRRWVLRSAVQTAQRAMRFYYPDLVGKRIRHLYEEDDKSEVWYRGEVLRIHEAHTNPLKTVFEVRYDSEPEWKYYLELLIDYKKGWLKIED
ncbi:uncharacterized protein C15orf39 homolog [Poeciliopsis prolifica]|uniref:uncharacterized protein C15orf39 homolog n=1 Tax=Poeciliopsis prolifica TaxID=188132 RepID=UPI0024131E04|nr:uncharacterized protein C15orf39 homolog [Poeciliopsis prolifica]